MNNKGNNSRRTFLKTSALAGVALTVPTYGFNIIKTPSLNDQIIGHGDFQYRVEKNWGDLNPSKTPVNNCHEMVMDAKKRLIMLTDHPKNNVVIYDKSGKLIHSWTLGYKGAHGLAIHDEGGEEFLYITDPSSRTVVKTTLDGKIIMTLDSPQAIGEYSEYDKYKPTETTVAPNGDIYVADGYGSQFILQFNSKGEFIRKFGGDGFRDIDKFKTAHGVTLDTRDKNNPTLICTARVKNTFKRFSLDGKYIEDFYLPGAFISRAVIDDDNIYSGVCFGMSEGDYRLQENKGFVTILDKNNKVVSNPGGTAPVYKNEKLDLMLQDQPIFKHCHDVCVDDDKNLYVCQWNAGKVYPYKLHRV